MRRFNGFGPAVVVMLAWLAGSVPAGAQAPASSPGDAADGLRGEITDLKLQLIEAEATAAEIKDEQRLLGGDSRRGGDAGARALSAKTAFWEEVLPWAAPGKASAGPPIELVDDDVEKAVMNTKKRAIEACKAALQHDMDFRAAAARTDELLGDPAGKAVSSGPIDGSLIALGTMAVLGGLILTVHESRDRLRWRLRAMGSRPSLVALALLVPLAAAMGASPGITDDGVKPPAKAAPAAAAGSPATDLKGSRDQLQEQLKRTKRANEEDQKQLETDLEKVRRARATFGLKPDEKDPLQKEAADQADRIEKRIQEDFFRIRVQARIAAMAAAKAEQLEAQIKGDEDQLKSKVIGKTTSAIQAGLIRMGTCGLFILAVVVPLTRVRRNHRRERDEQSRICPRCLNKDTLAVDDSSTDVVEGLQARFRLMVCDACQYEIRENYVVQNRLCFPTVGIRASGKTHWMMMLYDQIKNANIPVASAIRKIPSREDERFDDLLRRLLYQGATLESTQLGLPYPLTFHVHDADPLGANKTMVNLFDFSGEMVDLSIDLSEFRSRALLCEGFTLFLDPTQVTRTARSKPEDLTIEEQIKALAQFAEEMHAIRGLSAEVPIDMPIAVCVSKVDLVASHNIMGSQAIPFVAELRETMNEKVDLALIQRRSQLCARAMPLMFQGWNVERTLRENFGGRYMFFPMSAVGLEGAELGVDDLSRRTITPCGMIEPLLWLLHMHGYCVLH